MPIPMLIPFGRGLFDGLQGASQADEISYTAAYTALQQGHDMTSERKLVVELFATDHCLTILRFQEFRNDRRCPIYIYNIFSIFA